MAFSLTVKSDISGLLAISRSSPTMIGFIALPSFQLSSFTGVGRPGMIPALRHVAWRAKPEARPRCCGAMEAVVETEEMEEAREERERSVIMDSGLEPEEAVETEGRRVR